MKRAEFETEVTSWWELKDLCDEVGCEIMEDFIDGDYRDEIIDDELVDLARNNTWQDLYRILSDYDDQSGYDYYIYDSYYGTYNGVSNDEFEDYKQQVCEWMDQHDEWDEEDEDEDYELPEEETVFTENNSVPTPKEDCTFDDMFDDGVSCIRPITADDNQMSVI